MTKLTTPKAFAAIFDANKEAREKFPAFKFSLDGNLVGDMADAMACAEFKLTPLPRSHKGHDATDEEGKLPT